MKTILVIYEMIPENTDVFLLHVTAEEASKIEACAGCFINDSLDWEKKPTEWLSEFLRDKPKVDIKKPFQIAQDAPVTVMHTGFVM